MKKLIILLAIAAIGCNHTEPTAENKTMQDSTSAAKPADTLKAMRNVIAEFEKLNSVLKKFEAQPQHFTVAAGKPSQVTGKKGTLINIDPTNLETEDGKPMGKNIEVELKELTNQTDLLKAGAQTMSDGRLLVSGGAYNITMTSDGSKLRIKNGKTLKVQFPVLTDKPMSLYYGERDSTGKMNWKEAKQEMVREKMAAKDTVKVTFPVEHSKANIDTPVVRNLMRMGRNSDPGTVYLINGRLFVGDTMRMTKEERQKFIQEKKTYGKLYAEANISRLGWFNCDRLLKAEATDVKVQFSPSDSVRAADIFLVFKNINSVLGANYFSSGKELFDLGITGAPIGYKAMLLAYTVKGDKIFADASDITIEKGMTVTPKLRQMSEEEFGKVLNSK